MLKRTAWIYLIVTILLTAVSGWAQSAAPGAAGEDVKVNNPTETRVTPSPSNSESSLPGDEPAGEHALPKRPEQLEFAPLEFQPPRPEIFKLENGIKVFFLHDDELPLVGARALFGGGRIHDPHDQRGLAEITAKTLRSGGIPELSGDELDEELEFLSAQIEVEAGDEELHADLSVLKKDLDTGFRLLSAVLRRPQFAAEKLDLERKRVAEALAREYDEPAELTRRQFRYLVWGEQSPWAVRPAPETLERITREAALHFHGQFIRPQNMRLAVWGDLTRAELDALLQKYFADWQAEAPALSAVEKIRDPAPGVYLVQRPLTQAYIRAGHLGPRRLTENEHAIKLYNQIFGLGFNGRLMREIRSNRGLAYSVFGSLLDGTDRGMYINFAQTKSESAVETIEIMRREIRKMREDLVAPEELERVKNKEINTFVFKFDSGAEIARERMRLDFLGYPPDYLENYIANIEAVTREDVQDVARRLTDPENLVTLIVGDRAQITELEKLGTVIDYQIKDEVNR